MVPAYNAKPSQVSRTTHAWSSFPPKRGDLAKEPRHTNKWKGETAYLPHQKTRPQKSPTTILCPPLASPYLKTTIIKQYIHRTGGPPGIALKVERAIDPPHGMDHNLYPGMKCVGTVIHVEGEGPTCLTYNSESLHPCMKPESESFKPKGKVGTGATSDMDL